MPGVTRLEQLEEFKKEHNHCNVPRTYPANRQLGSWFDHQLRFIQLLEEGKPSQMTKERLERLQALGVDASYLLSERRQTPALEWTEEEAE